MSDFSSLLNDAIKELSEEFREKLENVAIIVEDYPSKELLERMEVPEDETLFGLYEGVLLTAIRDVSPRTRLEANRYVNPGEKEPEAEAKKEDKQKESTTGIGSVARDLLGLKNR